MILAANGLQVEGLPLVLCDGITDEPGTLLQPVIEIADEKVVYVGQIQSVITDVLILLQLERIVHRLNGFGPVQVFPGEDIESHLVKAPVESIPDLGDFAFQNAPHGKRHGPVGELLYADVLAFLETVSIAVLQDLLHLFVPGGRGDSCNVLQELFFGFLALFHGAGDLDADGAAVLALEVRAVPVHEAVELAAQQSRERDLSVLLEETSAESALGHRLFAEEEIESGPFKGDSLRMTDNAVIGILDGSVRLYMPNRSVRRILNGSIAFDMAHRPVTVILHGPVVFQVPDGPVGGILDRPVTFDMANGTVRSVLDGAVRLDMGDGPV